MGPGRTGPRNPCRPQRLRTSSRRRLPPRAQPPGRAAPPPQSEGEGRFPWSSVRSLGRPSALRRDARCLPGKRTRIPPLPLSLPRAGAAPPPHVQRVGTFRHVGHRRRSRPALRLPPAGRSRPALRASLHSPLDSPGIEPGRTGSTSRALHQQRARTAPPCKLHSGASAPQIGRTRSTSTDSTSTSSESSSVP